MSRGERWDGGDAAARRGARRRPAHRVLAAAFAALLALAAPTGASRADDATFAAEMRRFAEILGALTHLDGLCSGGDGAVWRAKMQALLDAEAPPPDLRRGYVDAFNRANRTYASLHLACNARARAAIDRLLGEGGELAERLATS